MADKKIFIADGPRKPKNQHSKFDLRFVNNTSFKFGQVRCVYCREFPTGSRVSIKPSFAFDMMPLVYPIQTNVRAHLKFYRIPFRILWDNFEDFFSQIGADGLPNNQSASVYKMPYIKRPTGWNPLGSLADDLGCSNYRLTEYTTLIHRGVMLNAISSQTFNINPEYTLHTLLPLSSSSGLSRGAVFTIDPNNIPVNGTVSGWSNSAFGFQVTHRTSASISNGGSCDVMVCRVIENGDLTNMLENQEIQEFPRGYKKGLLQLYSVSVPYGTSSSSGPRYSTSANPASVVIGTETCYQSNFVFRALPAEFYNTIQDCVDKKIPCAVLVRFSESLNSVLFDSNPFIGTLISQGSGSQMYHQIDASKLDAYTYYRLGLANSVSYNARSVQPGTSTLFDSVNGADPVQPINALPFRAMEFIHNYFFRNQRIDPYIKDGVPTYNKFLTNTGDGADSTTPVDTWKAFYEDDYFTTCVKEPQFGNAPLVGVTVNDLGDTGILKFQDDQQHLSYKVSVDINQEGQVLPLSVYGEDANHPNIHRLQELIDFGISINDLRNVSTFQRMLERIQRSGYKYQNVVYEFFGTNPPIGDHYPRYIGGLTRMMSVDKITQVAETEQRQLGSFAGQGRVTGQGHTIRTYCSEHSYVIGIMYFSVTPTYSQRLPKHLIKSELLDYLVNPDFNTISPQPVYAKEIAPLQIPLDQLNAVFGYNRPYADYVSAQDEVHGLFRSSMANFLLQRFFGSTPQLNKSFIEVNSPDLTNIFSVTEDEDKIYGQILFDCKATMPMPRMYTPRSI